MPNCHQDAVVGVVVAGRFDRPWPRDVGVVETVEHVDKQCCRYSFGLSAVDVVDGHGGSQCVVVGAKVAVVESVVGVAFVVFVVEGELGVVGVDGATVDVVADDAVEHNDMVVVVLAASSSIRVSYCLLM